MTRQPSNGGWVLGALAGVLAGAIALGVLLESDNMNALEITFALAAIGFCGRIVYGERPRR